jgi:outer membrane immunogenic protein
MRMLVAAAVAATAIAANGSTLAADVRVPIRTPPPPPPVVQAVPYNWSTCYVGTHSGLAAGHTTWKDTVPNGAIDAALTGQTANTDMSGAIYGAQIGCDVQMSGNFVVGLEGSFAGSTLAGTNMDQFNSTWTLRARTDWIGTITGRAGIAVDRALIYWRGGAAWARNKFEIENTAIFDGRPAVTRSGYVIGSGIEWAFAPSWSVFLEGNYFNFGNTDVPFAGDVINPTAPFTVRTNQIIETVKFGVNYRMGGTY